MTNERTPLLNLPVWQRVRRVARNSLALSILGIPLYLAAIFGGRFQRSHGSVSDMWLLAVCYPLGLSLSSVVGALFGRWWTNRWTAAIAIGVSMVPLFGLISLAEGHSGPTAPYRIDWSMTFGLSTIFAVLVAIFYSEGVRRFDAAQERSRTRHGAAV